MNMEAGAVHGSMVMEVLPETWPQSSWLCKAEENSGLKVSASEIDL